MVVEPAIPALRVVGIRESKVHSESWLLSEFEVRQEEREKNGDKGARRETTKIKLHEDSGKKSANKSSKILVSTNYIIYMSVSLCEDSDNIQ